MSDKNDRPVLIYLGIRLFFSKHSWSGVSILFENEFWKPVTEYPDKYLVSSLGRVKRISRKTHNDRRNITLKERMMALRPDRLGYTVTSLSEGRKTKNKTVHRLVCLAFLSPIDGKNEVNHKNGDKRNNRIRNLEWSDRSHNINHAYKNRLIVQKIGSKRHDAKLNEDKVREIKRLVNNNVTYSQIAEKYNIDQSLVYRIVKGKIWKHVK